MIVMVSQDSFSPLVFLLALLLALLLVFSQLARNRGFIFFSSWVARKGLDTVLDKTVETVLSEFLIDCGNSYVENPSSSSLCQCCFGFTR